MKTKLLILSCVLLVVISCQTQKNTSNPISSIDNTRSSFRLMFYNAENLFDFEDDPNISDEEFTPEGTRYWSEFRYYQKLSNVYKVIVGVGEWDLPQIVGLAEIENKKVLEDLLKSTPLYKSDYKIIHFDSPDARGIDVGLLYRGDFFTPLIKRPIKITWPASIGTGTTRDILYVCGVTANSDTLHIFVNHWPSRYGGQMETEGKRGYVAKLLKTKTDSIFDVNPRANIVIMGDLNDYPTDKSLNEGLKAQNEFTKFKSNKLYNLSYYLQEVKKLGTNKYQGDWRILDQILVSGALMDSLNTIYTSVDNAFIFNADFLLEKDEKFTGQTTNRTYIGYKYHGGFSDHLPTYVDLIRK